MLSLRTVGFAAAAALILGAGSASADTFSLDLTGSAFTPFTQDVPGFHLDRGVQSLGGLDDLTTLTVAQGDTVNTTITFDGEYTIPGSVDRTSFLIALTNASDFPAGDTFVTGETHFFLGGVEVKGGISGGLTTTQLANDIQFVPPDNGPITFDTITSNFTINTLSAPVTLNRATALYTLFTAVPVTPTAAPEPASWGLMLGGFFGMGGALRLRRRALAAACAGRVGLAGPLRRGRPRSPA